MTGDADTDEEVDRISDSIWPIETVRPCGPI